MCTFYCSLHIWKSTSQLKFFRDNFHCFSFRPTNYIFANMIDQKKNSCKTSDIINFLTINSSLQIKTLTPWTTLWITQDIQISTRTIFLYFVRVFIMMGFNWFEISINIGLVIWKICSHLFSSIFVKKRWKTMLCS